MVSNEHILKGDFRNTIVVAIFVSWEVKISKISRSKKIILLYVPKENVNNFEKYFL